tara:strand:+ start:5756 stop:5911 length:156 start_codon:yes stop_codon:yes gene_type:complete
MKKFEIHFHNEVEHESIEECIDTFKQYLAKCVDTGDISVFQFYELKEGNIE